MIHSKGSIQKGIDEAFDAVIHFIRSQDDILFERSLEEGKWTTGQQLVHLIKSVEPLNKGLKLPKFLLAWRYGRRDRREFSYEELVSRYDEALKAGGRATSPYIPPVVSLEQKKDLLERYEQAKIQLIKVLDKWNEDQLSNRVGPHPLLGKLSIREILFFTIHHNYHHLRQIENIT